jgi:hypothetical protein
LFTVSVQTCWHVLPTRLVKSSETGRASGTADAETARNVVKAVVMVMNFMLVIGVDDFGACVK